MKMVLMDLLREGGPTRIGHFQIASASTSRPNQPVEATARAKRAHRDRATKEVPR